MGGNPARPWFDQLSDDLLMEILKRVPFLDRKWVVPQVSKRFAEITSIPSAVWDEVDITLDRSRYQHTKPLDLPAAFKDVTSWLAKRSLALADPAASASRAGHSRHRLKVADDRCEFLSHSPFANLAHNWPCLHTFVLELYPQVVCPNSYDEAGGEWQIRAPDLDALGLLLSLKVLHIDVRAVHDPADLEERSFLWHGGFPSGLCALTNLMVLDFTGTGDDDEDMGELPAAMSRLVSLERLVLRFCGISGLALPSLAKLPRLHTLELQELHRLTWPDMEEDRARLDTKGIGELTSLRCLNFRCIDLDEPTLPDEISRLTGLRTLILPLCHLQSMPAALGCLTSLQKLSLSRNPDLASLPASISCLTALTYLSLNNCASLPQWRSPAFLTCFTSLRMFNGRHYAHSQPKSARLLAGPLMTSFKRMSKACLCRTLRWLHRSSARHRFHHVVLRIGTMTSSSMMQWMLRLMKLVLMNGACTPQHRGFPLCNVCPLQITVAAMHAS